MILKYLKNLLYVFVLIGFSASFADDKVSFFRAVNIDNASTVESMLAAGFDPNTLDEKGQTALYMALREDAPKVIKALLAHPDTKADLANAANETPLMMAALRGNLVAATALVEKGAAINRGGWTPLHYAASGPHTALVEWLVGKGAALEAESPNKTTPLMMASRYGSEDSTLFLLARGASAKARNDQGLNAADFARLGARELLAKKLDEAAR